MAAGSHQRSNGHQEAALGGQGHSHEQALQKVPSERLLVAALRVYGIQLSKQSDVPENRIHKTVEVDWLTDVSGDKA